MWRSSATRTSRARPSDPSGTGPAIPVADRMGILPQLRGPATRNRSLTLLDPGGRRIPQLPLASDEAPTVEVTRVDLCGGGHRNSWRRSSTTQLRSSTP